MARPKFRIETKVDSMNFHDYVKNNMSGHGGIRDEILYRQENKSEEEKRREQEAFKKAFKKNSKLYYRHAIGEVKNDELFEKQTELLYMLPYNRIQKIKTSLRSKRKTKFEKSKKQLTIDKSAYFPLKRYANRHNITLSQAIEKLLEGDLSEPK